jgi:hypothetical protein
LRKNYDDNIELFGPNGQLVVLVFSVKMVESNKVIKLKYKTAGRTEDMKIFKLNIGNAKDYTINMKNWKELYSHLGLIELEYEKLFDVLIPLLQCYVVNDDSDSDSPCESTREYDNSFKQFKQFICKYLNFVFEMSDKTIDLGQLDIESKLGYKLGRKYLLKHPLKIQNAPDIYKNDRELVMKLGDIDDKILEFVPDSLKDAQMFQHFSKEVSSLIYFPDYLNQLDEKTAEQLSEHISNNPLLFKLAPLTLKDNKELVLSVLQKKPEFYEHISPRLKVDIDCIRLSFIADFKILDHLQPEVYLNDQIIQDRIASSSFSDYDLLIYANDKTRSNADLFLRFIYDSDKCLKYASEDLCNNKQFFLDVSQKLKLKAWHHDNILERASLDVLLDEAVMRKYVYNFPFTISVICKKYSTNTQLHKLLLKCDFNSSRYFGKDAYSDEVIELMMKIYEEKTKYKTSMPDPFLRRLPDTYRNNREFASRIIKLNPKEIEGISQDLHQNKQFLMEVLQALDESEVKFVYSKLSDNMARDKDIIPIVVRKRPNASIRMDIKNRELLMQVLQLGWKGYDSKTISQYYSTDREVIKIAVTNNGNSLNSFIHFHQDEEILQLALVSDIYNMRREIYDKYRYDAKWLLPLVIQNGSLFSELDASLRMNKQFIVDALENCQNNKKSIQLRCIDASLQRDPDILRLLEISGDN